MDTKVTTAEARALVQRENAQLAREYLGPRAMALPKLRPFAAALGNTFPNWLPAYQPAH